MCINNSYAAGNVIGSDFFTGGLVGVNDWDGYITPNSFENSNTTINNKVKDNKKTYRN